MTIKFRIFNNLQGIILILIIAIVVLVLLFAYVNARISANDQKRLADIGQIQAALKVYFDENGFYPASNKGLPKDIETYLNFWPTAPSKNGKCSDEKNTYTYVLRPGMDYWVSFCLGRDYNNLSAGTHRASSKGIE
ncbi:MAG TPA: hypothetical protein VF974_05755 [Patescibacteria group bacterium]